MVSFIDLNGSVERKHKYIVETGLTLLPRAGLPFCYWDYAFLIATCLVNRMPTTWSPLTSDYFNKFLIINS